MKTLQLHTDPRVRSVFGNYPRPVRAKMERLRELIIETAKQTERITTLEEALRWGDPGYITKRGSTVRIGWKPQNPDRYAIYFQCTTALIPTFRTVYKNLFAFEANRAIVFHIQDRIPVNELKSCIATALTYHTVKHLPALGL